MGQIYDYLSGDHERLDALLRAAFREPRGTDMSIYSEFRRGMLRHIGMEEKIILPAIAKYQDGRQAEVAARLRLDHGAIVALLVPSPSKSVVDAIRGILEVHNALEEQEDGLYNLIERLSGTEAEGVLAKLKAAPEVPALPHNDRPGIIEATRRAVERAGYTELARALTD